MANDKKGPGRPPGSKNNSNLPLNKVFHSPYKDEIERRLAMGQSPRAIGNWLKTRGEEITHTTINEYKRKYFNTDAEAGKIVKQKQEELIDQLPEPVKDLEEVEEAQKALLATERNKAIGTIRAVNHIAVLYENIHDMRLYLEKLQSYEPVVAAHAAKGLYAEIRATIESLEKIAQNSDDKEDTSVARLLSGLKVKAKELKNYGNERPHEGNDE
jgi:hypothetical protein